MILRHKKKTIDRFPEWLDKQFERYGQLKMVNLNKNKDYCKSSNEHISATKKLISMKLASMERSLHTNIKLNFIWGMQMRLELMTFCVTLTLTLWITWPWDYFSRGTWQLLAKCGFFYTFWKDKKNYIPHYSAILSQNVLVGGLNVVFYRLYCIWSATRNKYH